MKKSFPVILILSIMFSFYGCAEDKTFNEDDFTFGGEYYLSPLAPQEPRSFNDITAAELVSEMIIGWSLGNTMDASSGETSWGNPKTTMANITTLKNAGFNTIRIPVSWSQAVNKKEDYKIRENFMDRVTEIVEYCVANEMYIIINTHHDEDIFKFTENARDSSLIAFYHVWSQIAYNFKNYDEKLIFEGLNEPRTKGTQAEWQGGTPEERAILNEHYELFTKIVRASGGNNNKRVLSINPYAGSAFNPAVSGLVLPQDTIENKLLVQIHCYNPYFFALDTNKEFNTWSKDNSSDRNSITSIFTASKNKFLDNGVPVIVGEFGAMYKDNDDAREEWAEFYVSEAKKAGENSKLGVGIPCIVWDNGAFTGSGELFAILNRRNNTFPNPKYLNGLLRGAGVIE